MYQTFRPFCLQPPVVASGVWSGFDPEPTARPAGRIFVQDGKLIRPSQDSSRRYGYALKFNRIIKLDEKEYAEEAESTFKPAGGRMLATHTFNQAGGLTVVDAIIRRRK